MLRQLAAELHLNAYLNWGRVTQTCSWIELPRFHGLSGRLVESVVAHWVRNGNISNEAVSANYNYEPHSGINFFLSCFFRAFRGGCVVG